MLRNFTRKTLAICLMLVGGMFAQLQTSAQCDNDNLPYLDLTPFGVGAANANYDEYVYGGDDCSVNVCSGATYTFSTCGASYDTQLSLYSSSGLLLGNNDDGCGIGSLSSFLTWTATLTGTVHILLDEYVSSLFPCESNTTPTTLTVTQTTACPGTTCSLSDAAAEFVSCSGTQELVNFYAYYTGGCTVDMISFYSTELGWEDIDLSEDGITSGDPIGILLGQDNTEYLFYFTLSNGETGDFFSYTTITCPLPTCNFTGVETEYLGCDGTDEAVNFYPYFSGGCTVDGMWIYTMLNGWEFADLSGNNYVSGDAILLYLTVDNTEYQYYFILSNGTESITYTYDTGTCDEVSSCNNLQIFYTDNGCVDAGGTQTPFGTITPFYIGGCTIEGIYSSVDGSFPEFLDLSAYNLNSGDAINLFFNNQDAYYEVFYQLSDGTSSPITSFITPLCGSGETICDCAGTQLPIEATSWLGDASLDDGSYHWNGDPTLPVDFNCATWGFDCGDELEITDVYYDPYGVCSGAIPPANGCVDEFCYNIDLDIATDCHPEDIDVFIYNEAGDQVFTADHINIITISEQLYTFGMCLPAGCYSYLITDAFGDGLGGGDCATIGYTGIWDYAAGEYVVYAEGNEYEASFLGEFCVGPETECEDLEIEISDAPCFPGADGLLPSIHYTFDFSGPCTVQSIFYSVNGAEFEELNVSANGWGSGDEGFLYYLQANADYTIYYTTDDGASSFLYDFSTGNCGGEITICDCAGTQHSIGVTSWLGDTYADNGFYNWNGQPVDFNCSTWGYDCGDVDGAPSFDPYNVCEGQLPPFNGCIDTEEVLGCTDPEAVNFEPDATINDGSCLYSVMEGCMDADACNYNELAVINDNSCEYISCAGCMDDAATNYDPTATIDDDSCIYLDIDGCTNPEALNYDPIATDDDGSCIYTCVWPTVSYEAHCVEGDLNNFYVDIDLSALGNGAPYTITNSYNTQQQVMTLTGSVQMGPFPEGTVVVVLVSSNTLDCIPLSSTPLSNDCSEGGVYGCTDPSASNYDTEATIDDGSCVYIIYGCTDEDALNYNSLATNDDGSCVFTCIWPTVAYDAHCTSGDLGHFYIDVDITALGNGAPYTIANSYNMTQQVMGSAGSITIGPFPSGATVVVAVTSNTLDCIPLTSSPMTQDCSVAGVYGCTDPDALNYNASANINDGSCMYEGIIFGCMDPEANNYNPDATIDDGSCLYDGVEEIMAASFSIYPNPAKDRITIVNNGKTPMIQIRIMDATGRTVESQQASVSVGSAFTVNVSALAQGNYIVQILSDGQVEHHSIVIAK